MTPTAEQWAWIAGLFEGEGWIEFRHVRSVQVGIIMTDRDVLETLDGLIPSANGLRLRLRRQPTHKDQFEWTIQQRLVVAGFLQGVLPWLHSRRRQRALDALVRLEYSGHNRDRTHCKRAGHPLSGDNLYVIPGSGGRACVACARERKRIAR